MGWLFLKIGEFFKVILAVLGIISAYPDVTVDNLFVYQNFQDPLVINAQFRAYNLVNSSVRDIIEGGIDVNIIYQIRTSVNENLVYSNKVVNRISYSSNNFQLNHKYSFNFSMLTNTIGVNELVVLTNSENYRRKNIKTEIEILINCDATPEIINLWGNKPRITLYYSLGE